MGLNPYAHLFLPFFPYLFSGDGLGLEVKQGKQQRLGLFEEPKHKWRMRKIIFNLKV